MEGMKGFSTPPPVVRNVTCNPEDLNKPKAAMGHPKQKLLGYIYGQTSQQEKSR
ncbi:hypothetical protein SAY86_003226 [Trapa natans]|uniref:Uncharacterized protein n=1 Tax=Trapa natans TaxID=22666 RepID=A0AAN7MD48_TRANT|nr:hypothetical protein SAY86_003226 [Trapa natans]